MTEEKGRFKMFILKKSDYGIIPMLSQEDIRAFEIYAKRCGLNILDDYRVFRLSDYSDDQHMPQSRLASLKEMHFAACLLIQEHDIDMGMLCGLVVVFTHSQAALLETDLVEKGDTAERVADGTEEIPPEGGDAQ